MSVNSLYACCLVVGLVALTGSACAGDWPQWRGPNGDGFAVDEDLADTWPETGPPVLWTREIGQGYSAFVVADGRAYTQTQTLYEQRLICLDAETGAELWSQRYGWPFDGGGLYPGPRATPTVAEGRVYYAAPNGEVGCVDALTGSPIWSSNPKDQYRGRGTDFGVSASPVYWRGLLLIPVGGPEASLVALDAATGALVWKCGELPASYATPIVVPYAGRSIVIAPLENSLLCADAETGRQLWELDLSQGYDEHSAAPLYREPELMLAGPFRSGARCLQLFPTGEPPGCRTERVWDSLKFSNDIASSVLVGEHIYGFDLKDAQSRLNRPSRGEFRCLNWSDGKVLWSSPEPGHANIIGGGDKLLLFNDRGELRLAEVSAEGYAELGSTTIFTDEICWTPPALAEGRVFLRTQTRAACLYIGRKPLTAKQPVQTVAEIPQSTRFDAAVLIGGEREFPATTPEWSEYRLWYLWTLAGIVAAWAAFGGVLVSGWCLSSRVSTTVSWSVVSGRLLYWLILLTAGAGGSAVLNSERADYVFTWPLALWGLMQIAVEASLWAVRHHNHRWAGWQARGAILFFVLGCGLYFHLCRQLGAAIEWSFLGGFIAAYPVSILGDWLLRRLCRYHFWMMIVVHVTSYSAYFWGCAWFAKWWLRVGS